MYQIDKITSDDEDKVSEFSALDLMNRSDTMIRRKKKKLWKSRRILERFLPRTQRHF